MPPEKSRLSSVRARIALVSIGFVLLALAVLLRAAFFFRAGFAIEGLLLVVWALVHRPARPTPPSPSLELPRPEGESLRYARLWLAAITVLAALLRVYRLGSDLWSDELTTVVAFRAVPPLAVITASNSPNNHVLNTLLTKASIATFGEAEWAIRLPAVLFGVACIPAIYALARLALGQRDSLFAAFLLSVSYHHIFFSQNARGYTGMLFGGMLGTTFFFRSLASDRPRDWAAYVAAMFLSIASVLTGAFVIVGHAAALAAARLRRARPRGSARPLIGGALVAWGALALLSAHLYAGVFAPVERYATSIYTTRAVGYAPFSIEHFRELVRGLSAGFGGASLAAAAVALVAMGFGFLLFARRQTVFTIALVTPLVAMAAFLFVRRWNFAPRFFLWALPAAWIFAVGAATRLGAWWRDRFSRSAAGNRLARAIPTVVVAALAAASILSLPAYYRTPKQASRKSLDWLAARRRADEPVVAAPPAKWGLRFYGPSRGLTEGRSFIVAETAADLERIEKRMGPRRIWVVTTFQRALALERPDLDRYIRERYRVEKTFPATIGEGEITVWSSSNE